MEGRKGRKIRLKRWALDKLIEDIIITDELGGTQFRMPCDIAFRIMQNRWRLPYEQMFMWEINPK
jgi:hypothetical protein